MFNSKDGEPTTVTYLALNKVDYKPAIHKDYKAGQGKICKTIVGTALADVTDHATCKAACVKAAAADDKTKAGKSCCSIDFAAVAADDAAKPVCILGEGDATSAATNLSAFSGHLIMTDAVAPVVPDEVDGDSAIRVAMGSLALAATTAMLSF